MNFPSTPYQAIPEPLPPPPSQNVGEFCFVVDGKWIPYLVAAVKVLAIDRTWLTQSRRATDEARNLMFAIMDAAPCKVSALGVTEMDDDMGCCLRWSDGVLEMLSCGEWVPVPGTPGGTPGPAGVTIPTGEGVPEAGECREYNLLLQAYTFTLLPVPVSSGDTVTVSEFKGAWSDSFPDPLTAFWYCLTGNIFALGFCSGAQHTESGDPLNTAPHMGLIAEIGGIAQYFDCSVDGITFTVPPGVTDEQVLFMANDSTPADNQGGVSFHVKVCKANVLPLTIAYAYGTGPAAANYGDVITVTAVDTGSANWGVQFTLSEDAKITVLNDPGYAVLCGGGCPFAVGQHPVGTDTTSITAPPNTRLTEFPASTLIAAWRAFTSGGGSSFQVQFRLDHP